MNLEILLIDDDALASSLRKRVLERHGYRVQLALDGHAGIALADTIHPALILMDHRLPDIPGPDLLLRLRETRPATPVIVYSGYEALADKYASKPNVFLTKGDGAEPMLTAIADHLVRKEAA